MLAGTTKRFQKSASKCIPMLGAVFTQKYSSARISLEEAVIGNSGNPFWGSSAWTELTDVTLCLLFLGGGML